MVHDTSPDTRRTVRWLQAAIAAVVIGSGITAIAVATRSEKTLPVGSGLTLTPVSAPIAPVDGPARPDDADTPGPGRPMDDDRDDAEHDDMHESGEGSNDNGHHDDD